MGNLLRTCVRRKILIVDDQPVVRLGLVQALARESDLEVCGEAASIEDALQQVGQTQPDLVLVEISLGADDGIGLIEQIRACWPSVKLLVVSLRDERVFAGRALRAGAGGYISKHAACHAIVEAVRQVLRGEVYLSPVMVTRLIHNAATGESLNGDPVESLSNRELQVFMRIGLGLTTAQIAKELAISPKTVEWYRKMVKEKLKLQNGNQLAQRAIVWAQENSRSSATPSAE